jgi:NAD(P)-dependent dehydrogenase (short-subunit alcohol dehydrogenase family)
MCINPDAYGTVPGMKTNSSRIVAARFGTQIIAAFFILLTTGCFAETDAQPDSNAKSQDRTVLITGANRGIGLELSRQFTEAGWQVIGTARKPDQAETLRGQGAQVMQLDVTSQDSVDRLAADLEKQSIDLLINNAGILPRASSISETDFDDVTLTLAVNTIGPMRVTRALLPNLQSGDGKTVVNITSGLGSIANNSGGGFYGYRESKAALNMFTRSLANELRGDGFICIVVHPGWVQTDMGGANATLTVQQSVQGIRNVIENLATEDTGTFWNFDGTPLPW